MYTPNINTDTITNSTTEVRAEASARPSSTALGWYDFAIAGLLVAVMVAIITALNHIL